MKIEHTSGFIVLEFDHPLRTLSSASAGGGYRRVQTIVNLKTDTQEMLDNTPEDLITKFFIKGGSDIPGIGLLTSAEMEYAQFVTAQERGIGVLAVVTAGISNALNIAERSDTEFSGGSNSRFGTINIIVITSAYLFDECMVSSIITATEAKTAALLDLQVRSVITGSQATGTGTDTIVIVSGNGMQIRYAGGHTLYGQLLGQVVYRGVSQSLLEQRMGNRGLQEICGMFEF
jgi:iron complex transport system ATP-binding protein